MAGSASEKSLLLLVAVGMTAGVAGFFAGRFTAPDMPGVDPVGNVSVQTAPRHQAAAVAAHPDLVASGAPEKAGQSPPTARHMTLLQAFSLADPQTRRREMDNVLAAATPADVQDGLKWALSLPEGFAKLDALGRIMKRWGELDGPAAASYGLEVLGSTGQSDLLEQALRGWGRTDPAASLRYSQAMAVAGDIKRNVSRALIGDWADTSPSDAAQFASSNPIDVGRGGWAGLVADRWSKQDPAAAAGWAATLAPGRDQLRAYDELVQNWCDLNMQAAAAFVAAQPPGPGKEVMVSSLAREVAKLDQNSALQWAGTLTDPVLQEDTAWSIVRRTARDDPAAAASLLQRSTLAPAVQQALVTRISAAQNPGGNNPGR